MRKITIFMVLFAFAAASPAMAYDNLIPSAANFSAANVTGLLKPVALGINHRAMQPAGPGGVTGFDIGLDVTVITIPTDFTNAMVQAGLAASSVPGTVPVPKINIHKGLPSDIDVGLTYSSSGMIGLGADVFSTFGFDIQWAPLSGIGPLPAVAARLSYSSSKLYFINGSAIALDGVVSKNFYVVEPYAGLGLINWSGSLTLPNGLTMPAGIASTGGGLAPHFFIGLPLKLMFLKITAELDVNTVFGTTYGGKLSLGF